MIELHPELFPVGIELGYSFHGFVASGKLHLITRRIRLKTNGQAYQLRPDTVREILSKIELCVGELTFSIDKLKEPEVDWLCKELSNYLDVPIVTRTIGK